MGDAPVRQIAPDDAVVLLHEGRVFARGTAAEIAGPEPLAEAFLGLTGLAPEDIA